MNKNDIIINYAKAQELGCVLRCPCCGKFTMNQHIDNNSISRLADIYICNDCGVDEAVAELEKRKNNTDNWYIFKNPIGLNSPADIEDGIMYTAKIAGRDDYFFDVRLSLDRDYPGLDIEIREKDPSRYRLSNPRVLIEWPIEDDKPRVLIWGDTDKEDYTDSVTFEGE